MSESSSKLEAMTVTLSESQGERQRSDRELEQLQESSRTEITELYGRLEDKTKAGKLVASYPGAPPPPASQTPTGY